MPGSELVPLGFGHYSDDERAPAELPADWREPKGDGRDWIRSQAVQAERLELARAEEASILEHERQVRELVATAEPSGRDWTDAVERRPDLVSAVVAIKNVDLYVEGISVLLTLYDRLKAHVEDCGAKYDADQMDRESIYAYRASQLEAERQRTEELESSLQVHKQRRMTLQGELRENRATEARAREQEGAIMEEERTARRDLELSKQDWQIAEKEFDKAQQEAREIEGKLRDELMDLKAKNIAIRRKLEEQTREMLGSIKEIDKQTRSQELQNVEDERQMRVNERQARDEAKAAAHSSKHTQNEIYKVKKGLLDLSKQSTLMGLSAAEAHGEFTQARTHLEQTMSKHL
jgi:hypothetical protein